MMRQRFKWLFPSFFVYYFNEKIKYLRGNRNYFGLIVYHIRFDQWEINKLSQ
jgi:hypothetical protein